MSETSKAMNTRRRLNLTFTTNRRTKVKVENPYLKVPKSASANTDEGATAVTTLTPEVGVERRRLDLSTTTNRRTKVKVENPYLRTKAKVENPYLKVPKSLYINTEEDVTAVVATITPEVGIDKFFVSKRIAGEAKPHAARKLVTPRETVQLHDDELTNTKGQKRKSLECKSEDDDSNDGLYYHSDEGSCTDKTAKNAKRYEPGHIRSILDYHHRGELPLDQGTLKAYRFIRNHFLIPRNIEADPKFGAYSGSCFEERVIRAYTLGQLEPRIPKKGSLLVCSYCGGEGHKRDDCLELL